MKEHNWDGARCRVCKGKRTRIKDKPCPGPPGIPKGDHGSTGVDECELCQYRGLITYIGDGYMGAAAPLCETCLRKGLACLLKAKDERKVLLQQQSRD